MTSSRDATAFSDLTGQPVNTRSEEWRIETEAWTILKMSKDERDAFFNGRKDADGRTITGASSAFEGSSLPSRSRQRCSDYRRSVPQGRRENEHRHPFEGLPPPKDRHGL